MCAQGSAFHTQALVQTTHRTGYWSPQCQHTVEYVRWGRLDARLTQLPTVPYNCQMSRGGLFEYRPSSAKYWCRWRSKFQTRTSFHFVNWNSMHTYKKTRAKAKKGYKNLTGEETWSRCELESMNYWSNTHGFWGDWGGEGGRSKRIGGCARLSPSFVTCQTANAVFPSHSTITREWALVSIIIIIIKMCAA